MKRTRRSMIGMDEWAIHITFRHITRLVKQKGWSIYEIRQCEEGVYFYAPVSHRKAIYATFEHAELRRTTGMLGFLFRQIRRPSRILCVFVSILIWLGCTHTIFAITLKGDSDETKQLITDTLNELGYEPPFHDHDMQQMKAEVRKQLENKIAWLEVSKEGSQYHIQFTTKEFATIEALGHEELIAQKDGVIEHFELQHGNKMVQVNDFVHKGDVLVSNVLVDSKNTNKEVYVKGKVYAYTWKDVHVEMPENNLPRPFQFYQLLFEARREASKDLNQTESVHKENILQFQDNTGTISMDIHYTLIEDITTPR